MRTEGLVAAAFTPMRPNGDVDLDAAPALPLYYYHLPVLTGVRLDMTEVMRGAGETVPGFAGIKFSEVDPKTFAACTELGGDRHEVMWGSDETLLTGLGAGATAAIGSTYCFAARVYREVMAAHAAGDSETAQLWQGRAASWRESAFSTGPARELLTDASSPVR